MYPVAPTKTEDHSSAQILLVEDHADTGELIQVWLSLHGYAIKIVPSAVEALRVVQTQTFSLIILDNWLPDGNGIELCKQIRAYDGDTSILFVSGAAYPHDIHQALTAGAQGYLTKPVELQKLSDTITRLLSPAETDLLEVGNGLCPKPNEQTGLNRADSPERRYAMIANDPIVRQLFGGDTVPPGTFHGGDAVPPGTFH